MFFGRIELYNKQFMLLINELNHLMPLTFTLIHLDPLTFVVVVSGLVRVIHSVTGPQCLNIGSGKGWRKRDVKKSVKIFTSAD